MWAWGHWRLKILEYLVALQLPEYFPVQQYCGVLKRVQALLHPSGTLNSGGQMAFILLLQVTASHKWWEGMIDTGKLNPLTREMLKERTPVT